MTAEVVKLANTLRSGRSERKLLWVQVPPSANNIENWKFRVWVNRAHELAKLFNRFIRQKAPFMKSELSIRAKQAL